MFGTTRRQPEMQMGIAHCAWLLLQWLRAGRYSIRQAWLTTTERKLKAGPPGTSTARSISPLKIQRVQPEHASAVGAGSAPLGESQSRIEKIREARMR